MKSWPWLFAFLLFLSFCPQTQAPQSQDVRVTLNHLSATTCRVRTSDVYDYHVSMTFMVANLSERPQLVANEIHVVTSESIASSEENAKHEIFITTMKEEYQAGERTLKEPTLNNFTVLKSGEARAIKFTPLIFSATTNPKVADGQTLQMGRSWVILNFSLLPEYFMFNSAEQFRTKWKSIGQLDSQIASTEPFAMDITINPKSPKCESH
jgi:hypothetical protein